MDPCPTVAQPTHVAHRSNTSAAETEVAELRAKLWQSDNYDRN